MADPANPFNTNPNPNDPPAPQDPPKDTFVDQLNAIQNENGEPKYKDVQSALTALGHSQQHITTLESEKVTREQELQTVRDELASKKSVEDFVTQLTSKQDPTPPAPSEGTGIDANAVNELITRQLGQVQVKATQDSNLQSVLGKLNELYGDKAGEIITTKAAELGTTVATLETMSKENPSMALAILGGEKVGKPQAPSQSSVNIGTAPKGTELQSPEKSLMRGATGKEVTDYWKQIQADVHAKFGVE